jgi:hypothetical protein
MRVYNTSVRFMIGSAIFLFFLLTCAEVPLKAYADPGSGLLLWQIVAAFFLGAVYQARKALIWIRKRK